MLDGAMSKGTAHVTLFERFSLPSTCVLAFWDLICVCRPQRVRGILPLGPSPHAAATRITPPSCAGGWSVGRCRQPLMQSKWNG